MMNSLVNKNWADVCLGICLEVMMVNRFNVHVFFMCKEDKLSSLEKNKNNNNIIKKKEREREHEREISCIDDDEA